MAFDQNTVPIDLRFLNAASTIAEESRVVPLTTAPIRNTIEGLYANTKDGGSPNSIPIYYPPTVNSDAGLLSVGCANKISGNTGWLPVMPTTLISPATVATSHSFVNPNPDFSSRTGSNVSDQVSEESGDDSSLSCKRLKFMCSFGGKILPRPSDGTLRYVGGQTRIISVRKEINYYELVQKLTDIYGQNIVIKYQLPEEDLDALVSVSCQDDLINMMDEYNKLVERSSDSSSSKLRLFLFSTSEVDSPSLGQLGDLESSGQRYVEAVNGIGDGGSGIMRRDSITSASTQNSDCGNEGVDNSTHNSQGNHSGPPSTDEHSPRGNFATSSQETSPRLVCLDTNTNPTAIYVEASSCAPLAIPMVKSQILSPRNDQEFVNMQRQQVGYYDLPQHGGGNFAPAGSYLIDPHQKVLNRTEYVQQIPSQTHLSTTSTVYTQQQYHNDAPSTHHYIPTIQMPVNSNHSTSHIRLRPNSARPMVHTQQIHPFECYPDHMNHHPAENSYTTYQSQAIPSMAYSDGWVPHQQVKFYDKSPKYEDCFMCQKSLPHTHSDTSPTSDQRDSPLSMLSSPNSVLEDNNVRVCPVNKATADHMSERQRGGSYQNFEPLYEIDKSDHSKVGVSRLTGGKQPPYGVVMGTIPQLCQENIVQQVAVPTQYIKQEDLMSKPICEDNSPVRTSSSQIADHQYFHEPLKDYATELRGINPVNPESCFTYDIRPVDRKVKNLQVTPPEVVLNAEIKSPPIDNPKKEQYIEPHILRQNQVIACPLSESQNFRPTESYELPYVTSPALSSGDPSHLSEKVSQNNEWKDITSPFQAQINHNDMDFIPSSKKFSSMCVANKVGEISDNSNSLFSNQHPWNLHQDTPFRPPNPNKSTIKNETIGIIDPFSCSRLSKESPMQNSGSSIAQMHLEDGDYDTPYNPAMNFGQEQIQCIKGVPEEHLQAMAEGVAVSVLQRIVNSNSQSNILGMSNSFEANQRNEVKNNYTETRHGDKTEDMNTKITEKVNLSSPVSDSFGRLQIIKDCDLEELRELGSGTFGTVYHGKWRGSDVAIKRINDRCFAGKPSEQERMRDDFWNEAIKLADLHHPNVVAFYGVVLDGPEDTVATVTEYMANGSLRTAIEKNERNLDIRKRLIIAMDVAFGMEYLHGKNIVHFDLKSDNLLVNLKDPHRPICKVGDLGLSKVKCQTLISGGVRGTLPWMAPELLNGSSSLVSEKVDVFSFGMVMWELLTGDEPYGDLHYGAIIGGIVSNTLRPPVPENCDPDWRALMERCWSSEPSERPNFTEIANQLRIISSNAPPRGLNQQSPISPQMQLKS